MAFVLLLIVLAGSFRPSMMYEVSEESFDYTDVVQLGVWGRAFNEAEAGYFNRLPHNAQTTVSNAVWELSQDTAGLYVVFKSNSSAIAINCSLLSPSLEMWHFPSTGVSGLDLYSWDDTNEAWRWVGTTRQIAYPHMQDVLAMGLSEESRLYRLHLPLYNGIRSLAIGVQRRSSLEGVKPSFRHRGSVVWYGTSILQGGVASRPGQAFTNILSRELAVEIFNFGFSGHGLMEMAVAQHLAKIENVTAFIIDCNPNMDGPEIANRTVPLISYLHQQQPQAAIVLAEGTTYGQAWYNVNVRSRQAEKREALRQAFTFLNKSLPSGLLYYVNGDDLMCPDPPDCIMNPTVAGTHPTDLGMRAIADYYKEFLPKVLKGTVHRLSKQHTKTSAKAERDYPLNDVAGPPTELHGRAKDVGGQYGTELHGKEGNKQLEWMRLASPLTLSSGNRMTTNMIFTDVEKLTVRGRAFNNTEPFFSRLPLSAKGVVRSQVWNLSQMATGINVVFVTDSNTIYLNYTLTGDDHSLWHMPTTGTSGCDLYIQTKVNDKVIWRWVGTVKEFASPPSSQLTELASGLPSGNNTYALFLPMRNSLASGQIGVTSGSFIGPEGTSNQAESAPVVWYGTSICQGGAVSRAGMTYTNILTQLLGTHQVWNFGFAGNGKMEINVAEFLTQINAAAFVIDCNPNLAGDSVAKLTQPLVKFFRKTHPITPIILAEGTTYGDFWFEEGTHERQVAKRQALRKAYEELVADGDQHLHYVYGDLLFGNNSMINPTVGGTHPSDLGHHDIASFYLKYLPPILSVKATY